MAKIELNELMAAASEVIAENQKEYNAQDNERALVYTLAYNDGVLDLMSRLKRALFPEFLGAKSEEAADEKNKIL